MQFGVLGPLYVAAQDSDAPQAVSAPRLRATLAVLLWRANQPVPIDELADLVWDGAPPGGGVVTSFHTPSPHTAVDIRCCQAVRVSAGVR
jgi:hypothetical protein